MATGTLEATKKTTRIGTRELRQKALDADTTIGAYDNRPAKNVTTEIDRALGFTAEGSSAPFDVKEEKKLFGIIHGIVMRSDIDNELARKTAIFLAEKGFSVDQIEDIFKVIKGQFDIERLPALVKEVLHESADREVANFVDPVNAGGNNNARNTVEVDQIISLARQEVRKEKRRPKSLLRRLKLNSLEKVGRKVGLRSRLRDKFERDARKAIIGESSEVSHGNIGYGTTDKEKDNQPSIS